MKRNIAFISEHASPLATLGGVDAGGQNVYVDKLTKALAHLGYQIDIYTRWDDDKLPQVIQCHNDIRVIHTKAGPIKVLPKEKIYPYMSEFKKNMLKFMDEEHIMYKLIHANFFMSALVAADIKKQRNIPFVVTFHALGKVRRQYQGKADGFPDERFAIEERLVREADQIIAECPQDREDLVYHYHANQDKISIIPCGYDPNEFYPIDKRLARMTVGLNPDEKVILQLGRMVPRKGVDNVIYGLAELVKKYAMPVRLVIVGGDTDNPDFSNPEMQRLKAIAEQLGILDYITFVGRKGRDQLKYYYNAADVFVSTPWYEPFGITPLEAMACGTPVIGSRVGGIKFSVIHGKTGFLVPSEDPQQLTERCYEILTNDKLADMFEKNALQRVKSFFTWSTIAHTTSTLYEKLLYVQYSSSEEYQDQLDIVDTNFERFIEAIHFSQEKLRIPLINASRILTQTLSNGGKILTCGNGGSAADAQHFAAELVGHFHLDKRVGLPALSLTSDTAILTAVANDFSYDEVFSRQVEAYGEPGDVFIGISTSGKSQNILHALKKAQQKNMICIGLVGKDGGDMVKYCDLALVVPSNDTQRIQELHSHIIHTLSELVEKQLFLHPAKEETKEAARIQPLFGIKHGTSSYKKNEVKDPTSLKLRGAREVKE